MKFHELQLLLTKTLKEKTLKNYTLNFLWWRHYDVKFLKLFWSVLFAKYLGILSESLGIFCAYSENYTFWWKVVVSQSQNFSFFPFIFLNLLYFWKPADVNIFSFSDWFFHFSILHYISFSDIYSYIRFSEEHKELDTKYFILPYIAFQKNCKIHLVANGLKS